MPGHGLSVCPRRGSSLSNRSSRETRSPPGLAVVWAKENTRSEIFEALRRKETYATTGKRMIVRSFGGRDFDQTDLIAHRPASTGYRKAVPMGGGLTARSGDQRPTFLIYARREPAGAIPSAPRDCRRSGSTRTDARVLEIPTPRWVVYAAYRFGTSLSADAALRGQEPAYPWPIWHTP